ncbi:helix-turn-helix domain-containing protein [Paenibacillus larvae]|uniref:Helix-turn-helix domain DNA-binding protein, excisionase family n=9 Tax=Fernvirus TaxID=2843380 RepID=A0A2I7SCU5_9CAUD|nr:helix-turn-helix domain-containing protein [Paenibacillus larvae]YP_009203237.1 helix-turn-helix domain-containing protein [Paenibacillus phage Fern]YP_009593444.1 helix-turn-helix domain-containing protein [Paenibacillus phage Willow]YP_009836298.1 helix-turn-helix domain-containing protein [Paenibacillus phage BN12]YP_009836445.1 helix-turn-helix domain-containing protein [Paenibacillus phage Pagassa]YP_009836515.1 helix-turn-helix domain-containing protein [Paenibacillus phage Tadhana]Y
MNRLHTVSEVAEILRVNPNYVYDLIRHGHLQALKLGRLKISTFELENFMKRNAGKDFSDLRNIRDLVEDS